MSVDKAVFQQFRTSIEGLGELAAPNEVPREQWVERAKDVFIDKLGRAHGSGPGVLHPLWHVRRSLPLSMKLLRNPKVHTDSQTGFA